METIQLPTDLQICWYIHKLPAWSLILRQFRPAYKNRRMNKTREQGNTACFLALSFLVYVALRLTDRYSVFLVLYFLWIIQLMSIRLPTSEDLIIVSVSLARIYPLSSVNQLTSSEPPWLLFLSICVRLLNCPSTQRGIRMVTTMWSTWAMVSQAHPLIYLLLRG